MTEKRVHEDPSSAWGVLQKIESTIPGQQHSGKSTPIAVFGAGYALQPGRPLTLEELAAFWRNLK